MKILNILVIIPLLCLLASWHPAEVDTPPLDRPPAFEKIYVTPMQILSTTNGIYYHPDPNTYIRTSAVRRDCHGTYVILIPRQCPICLETTYEKNPREGYDCPLYETEVFPHIWSKN